MLIWAYILSDADRANGQRALAIDIITDASPDRLVLRDQTRQTLTTLVRYRAETPSPTSSARSSFFALVGLVAAVAAGLTGALYLFLRSRRRTGMGFAVRPGPGPRRTPTAHPSPSPTRQEAIELSDELSAAIGEAARYGMEMIQETGGPLRPFMFQWTGEERRQSVLMGESMEDSVAMGRELARDLGDAVDGCVIAWDGYITVGAERSDALFFHAYERGEPASHVLVQRYEHSPHTRFRPKDNVTLIRQDAPLFASMAKRKHRTWGPLEKQSRADVRNIVARDPATGLEQLHFIITVAQLDHAAEAILDTFDAVKADCRENDGFGGEILFVVYGPASPGAELAPELVRAKATLDQRIARDGLQTAKGLPFRVRVEQRKSVF